MSEEAAMLLADATNATVIGGSAGGHGGYVAVALSVFVVLLAASAFLFKTARDEAIEEVRESLSLSVSLCMCAHGARASVT